MSLSSTSLVSGTPTNAGTFSFTVQVADNEAATAMTMFTVEIAHRMPAIQVQKLSIATLQLLVSGDANVDYIIEASTNLGTWATVFAINPVTMPFIWTNAAATNDIEFFRVKLTP